MANLKIQIHTGSWDGSAEYRFNDGDPGIRNVKALMNDRDLITGWRRMPEVDDNFVCKYTVILDSALKNNSVRTTRFLIFTDARKDAFVIPLKVDFRENRIALDFTVKNDTVEFSGGTGVLVPGSEPPAPVPDRSSKPGDGRLSSKPPNSAASNTAMASRDISGAVSKIDTQLANFHKMAQKILNNMNSSLEDKLSEIASLKQSMEAVADRVDFDRTADQLQHRIEDHLNRIAPAVETIVQQTLAAASDSGGSTSEDLRRFQADAMTRIDALQADGEKTQASLDQLTETVNRLSDTLDDAIDRRLGTFQDDLNILKKNLEDVLKDRSEMAASSQEEINKRLDRLNDAVSAERTVTVNTEPLPVLPQLDRDLQDMIETVTAGILSRLPRSTAASADNDAKINTRQRQYESRLKKMKDVIRLTLDDWTRQVTADPAVVKPVVHPLQLFLDVKLNHDATAEAGKPLSIPSWSEFLESRMKTWADSRSFSLLRAFRSYLETVDECVVRQIRAHIGDDGGDASAASEQDADYAKQLEYFIASYILVTIRASDSLIVGDSKLEYSDQLTIINGIDAIIKACDLEEIDVFSKPAFDPSLHEPIEERVADEPKGTVIGSYSRGFKYNGRVLKKVEVILSRGRQEE